MSTITELDTGKHPLKGDKHAVIIEEVKDSKKKKPTRLIRKNTLPIGVPASLSSVLSRSLETKPLQHIPC
ncbi:MAG: hypothetical protein CL920_18135 [Deltaproteobacteria bacterium]|nr:hypothetical protein [Deltaproteobacteria bacterium]